MNEKKIVIAQPGWVNGRKAFIVQPAKTPRIVVARPTVRRVKRK